MRERNWGEKVTWRSVFEIGTVILSHRKNRRKLSGGPWGKGEWEGILILIYVI